AEPGKVAADGYPDASAFDRGKSRGDSSCKRCPGREVWAYGCGLRGNTCYRRDRTGEGRLRTWEPLSRPGWPPGARRDQLGGSNSTAGECPASRSGREPGGRAARQWHGRLPRTGGAVADVDESRDRLKPRVSRRAPLRGGARRTLAGSHGPNARGL